MRFRYLRWGLGFALAAAAFIAVLGYVVMSLWNWLLPPLFGWPALGFLQAAALLVLTRILFGGFHGRHGMHWRHRFAERWERMTPEERERFRAGMRGRCGMGRHRREDPPPPETPTTV
jgi:hypothetical protein